MLTIHAISGRTITLGREGENLARQVVFDVSEWRSSYGDGTVGLIAQRNGDDEPYPCNITVDGSTVTWEVTAADTARSGYGRCELHYTVGDVLAKSETWHTYTADALGTPTPEPPEPQKAWVDKVLEAGQAAVDASVNQPKIGENGNWFVWDFDSGAYVDTGVKASGGDIVRIELADYGLYFGGEGVSVPQEFVDILRDALDNHKALYVYGTLPGGIEGTVLLGNMYEYDGMIIASGLGLLYTGSATPAWFALTVDSNNLIANVLMGAIEGEQGPSGENGADGYSPTIDVSREIDTTILTITDVNGTTTVEIPDGKDGAVSSVNGKTGTVVLTAGDLGAVSVPATASVGQTVVVKAVDADGKPTEWEAADMIGESNYELIEKIVVGYAITTSEPDDWADNWTAYYTNEGTMRDPDYVALSGDVAPAWEAGKYYAYSADGVTKIERKVDLDGKPYSFKRIAVFCVPVDSSQFRFNLFYGNDSKYNYAFIPIKNFANGKNGVAIAEDAGFNGLHMMRVYWGNWHKTSSPNSGYEVKQSYQETGYLNWGAKYEGQPFYKVSISGIDSTTVIPSGVIFRILGERA